MYHNRRAPQLSARVTLVPSGAGVACYICILPNKGHNFLGEKQSGITKKGKKNQGEKKVEGEKRGKKGEKGVKKEGKRKEKVGKRRGKGGEIGK